MGELDRALAHDDFPDGADMSLAALLSAGSMARYFELAESGALRARTAADPTMASTASTRVRVDCLAILARAGRVPAELPERPAMPVLKEPVGARQRSLLSGRLAAHARGAGTTPARLRLFAVIGVVLDTGARAGELCAMRLQDLGPDRETIVVTRRPQARSVTPPVRETVPLSAPTRAALRWWLDARQELVQHVQGTATAVWVSVRPNHAGVNRLDGDPQPRPAGMPLMPRGLARAYTRAIVELNAEMAGRTGWTPLPTRLEQLRRGID